VVTRRKTKKMGRPPIKILAKDLKLVERMAGIGLGERQIAYCIGMVPNTFDAIKKRDPKVFEAIEKGRSDGAKVVASKLMGLCEKGNLGAIVWWEKTRAGRREVVAHEGGAKPVEFTLKFGS